MKINNKETTGEELTPVELKEVTDMIEAVASGKKRGWFSVFTVDKDDGVQSEITALSKATDVVNGMILDVFMDQVDLDAKTGLGIMAKKLLQERSERHKRGECGCGEDHHGDDDKITIDKIMEL